MVIVPLRPVAASVGATVAGALVAGACVGAVLLAAGGRREGDGSGRLRLALRAAGDRDVVQGHRADRVPQIGDHGSVRQRLKRQRPHELRGGARENHVHLRARRGHAAGERE